MSGDSPGRHPIPETDLLGDLRGVADRLGRTPSAAEYQEHGRFSRGTIRNRFGSWNNGLREAGLEPRYKRAKP